VLYAVGAIFFEKVDDGFGIAVGAVAMAAGDELLAQGKMVVDLAVNTIHKVPSSFEMGWCPPATSTMLSGACRCRPRRPCKSLRRRAAMVMARHISRKAAGWPGVASEFENAGNSAHFVCPLVCLA